MWGRTSARSTVRCSLLRTRLSFHWLPTSGRFKVWRPWGPHFAVGRVNGRKGAGEVPSRIPEYRKERCDPSATSVMQPAVRLDRPVKGRMRRMSRIPALYRAAVIGETSPSVEVTVSKDPYCLASLKHYGLLRPLAQEARKPMFALKPADGAIGRSHHGRTGLPSRFSCLGPRPLRSELAHPFDDAQGWNSGLAGSSSPSRRPVDITFRPMGAVPDSAPPDGGFTPERMADLAKGLEETIAKIEQWGITVPGGSRLPKTVKLLQDVASATVVSHFESRSQKDCACCF